MIDLCRYLVCYEAELRLLNMYLFFDTETADLPRDFDAPETDLRNWPRIVQIAWVSGESLETISAPQVHLINAAGFNIARGAYDVHGISKEEADTNGVPLKPVLDLFLKDVSAATSVIAHNIEFDTRVVGAECIRHNIANPIHQKKTRCTMKEAARFCGIPSKRGFKWPRLTELHQKLFNTDFANVHDASSDCLACMRCFFELQKLKVM